MQYIGFIIATLSTGIKFGLILLFYLLTRKFRTEFFKYSFMFLLSIHLASVIYALLTNLGVSSGEQIYSIAASIFILVVAPFLVITRVTWSFKTIDTPLPGFMKYIFIATGVIALAALVRSLFTQDFNDALGHMIINVSTIYTLFILIRNIKKVTPKDFTTFVKAYIVGKILFLLFFVAGVLIPMVLPNVSGMGFFVTLREAFIIILNGVLIKLSIVHYFPADPADQLQAINKQLTVIYNLTRREIEVAVYLVEGLTAKEISEKMFISLQTTKNYVYRIYQKTGSSNKIEFVNMMRAEVML